jgi:hypothetical protein
MLRRPTSRLSLRIVLGTLVAMTIVAPAASADTQRYAGPAGADAADCSPANPCSITKAVAGASAGDEVIAAPGDYQLTATLATPAMITIRGVAGQPRPRLRFSGAGQQGLALGYNSLLRDVEIDQAEPTVGLFSAPGRVDRVIVTAPGTGPLCTTHVSNSIVRDSIFVARGANGRAICSIALLGAKSTSTLRNVTAMATGSSAVAIHAEALGTSTADVNLVNVIARGGPGGADLKTNTYNGGAATIAATHTNYGTESVNGGNISNGGGNQLFKTPLYVNAAAGDYRQAAGSPTIDAGINEPINGAYDFAGDPRRIGTTDIGADEFLIPPAATTGAAGTVTRQSATLRGSVTANGIASSYHFKYGRTAAYGKATPTVAVGGGLSAVATAAKVGGLSPATTYHYRIVATNAGGASKGADRTFTTASSPSQTSPPPAHTSPSPFAGVKLVSTRLSFSRRFITLKLSCPAGTVGRCSGRTKLTGRRRTSSRRVTLGRASFSIASGGGARVKVRVTRAGRRLLRSTPRLRGRAVNVARDGAGQSKRTVSRVTIRRRQL